MTTSNLARIAEIDSYTAKFARLTLIDKSETSPANLTLTVHPDTLSGLANAALIARVPLLDFIVNSAWENARELLQRQQIKQAELEQHPFAAPCEDALWAKQGEIDGITLSVLPGRRKVH